MNIVKLDKMTKSYNGVEVIHKASAAFSNGLNIIMGDSGSGKSTLLNIIGLIDDCTSGEILFDDIDINKLSIKEKEQVRAGKVSYVFQDNNLIDNLTVRENLNLALDIIGEDKTDYLDYVDTFGIEDLLDKNVSALSGGEKQRVAIVRALIKDTDIIMADEPSGSLDSENSVNVFNVLKKCSCIQGKIVIVVTHNKELAEKFGDAIYEISDGHLVCKGSPCIGEKSEREKERERK